MTSLEEGWERGSEELQTSQSDVGTREGHGADHPECHHMACAG